jgi:hypothetical protein
MAYFRTIGHFMPYSPAATETARIDNKRLRSRLRPIYGLNEGQIIP